MERRIIYCYQDNSVYSADETFRGDPKVDYYETGFTLSQWSSLTKEDKKKAKEIFKKKVESKEWEAAFKTKENASPMKSDDSFSSEESMPFALEENKPSSFSFASGKRLKYVVLQVTLKEKFIGTGSGNLTELEDVINKQASLGYRLHTITTSNSGSKGLMGGDRIQATMVFESID